MILHIFAKDVRRLWPGIGVSLAVLASLAWQDRWRADWLPGPVESYLNLIVQFVWALLLGLAVEQEPIAGDRQFWLTRPYRRRDLLAAKLLFAATFVQLPSLLADCYILAARGFSPWAYMPELLAKQALLVGALTLPSIALASLVRSFAHFVLEIVAVAAAALLLSGTLGHIPIRPNWEPFATVRAETLIVCCATFGAAIVLLQYLGRRVAWSRGLAAISAAASITLFLLFVPRTAMAIRATTHPAAAALAIRFDPSPRAPIRTGMRDVVINLPVAVSGVPAGEVARVDAVRTEIVSSSGRRWVVDLPTSYRPFDAPPFQAWFRYLEGDAAAPDLMFVQIDPKIFPTLQTGPVTIRGEAAVKLTGSGASAWMGVGESRYVDGVGRCYSSIVEDRITQRIKLECESPRGNVGGIRTRLWSPRSGREWKHRLGEARTVSGTPRIVWLSPIERDVTFWDVVPTPLHPTDVWRVPADEALSTRIEVTPQPVSGYSLVRCEFRDLDLRRYRMESVIPANVR